MTKLQINPDLIESHFSPRNWKIIKNEKGMLFYKKEPNSSDKIISQSKVIDKNFPELFSQFEDITTNYFSSRMQNFKKLNSINIFKGYNNNSFVSTGLEYYYDYLYKDKPVDDCGTMIIQPSIRFKLNFFNKDLYEKNDKYDYSSISFNNLSIVNKYKEFDIIYQIEVVIEYLSKLKIHASRVTFLIEDKVFEKDNNVSYRAIKFFVDNLEVGDILFFTTKEGYMIEYGFGFERLMSRIINKKYRDLFIKNNNYDQESLLGANFLTLMCLFDNNLKNRGAKSKINEVLNAVNEKKDIMDIGLIFDNYLYWKQIIDDPYSPNSFGEVTRKYIKMIRRK